MTFRFGSRFTMSALGAAVAIVAAAPALAQNTTSALSGQVLGEDGRPLAGATVVILHRDSGSSNTLTTDADGRFSARGLRVGGPYTVTASKGADRQVQNDLYLALAETLNLELRVRPATVLEAVVTTGSASVSKFNSDSMGAGTSLSRNDLNAYASIQRNLQDFARLDPRVNQTDKGNGEMSVAGQNGRFNSVTVDGVKINDTFGLEANGLPMLKQPISIDTIQAVQVNVSNYDVTQQGYTGANVNAVTKSGTNEFQGSVYATYRDNNMSGDRYSRFSGLYSPTPHFTETLKGTVLSGPIIKDKLFFLASYEELRSSRGAPAFGPVGSSVGTQIGITTDQINQAITAAKSKYNIDIGDLSIPKGLQVLSKDTLLKLDWNLNENHKANIRYAKSEESQPIFPGFSGSQGSSSLSLSSHWYTQAKTLESVVGQWFADWTDNFSTELKLSSRDYKSAPLLRADLPQISLTWTTPAPAGTPSGNRTLRFGTEQFRHFNNLATRTTNAYFAGVLALDKHELKVGVDVERNNIKNAFLPNTRGVYSFSSADPITQFMNGTPTSYQVQLPLPGSQLADGAANWTLSNVGVFAQDSWKFSKRLTLVGGLRVDALMTNDKPKANAAAGAALVAGNPVTGTRQSGGFGYDNTVNLNGKSLVQPRFGFNYNLEPVDGLKSQLRGGAGLFMGSAASVWLTNPYQNTGVATATFNCGGGSTPCSSIQFNPNTAQQPVVAGTPPAANVDFVGNGVVQPSVWKMNLAFDKELPWYGLTASAEWLHTQVEKGLFYQYLNLGAATLQSPLDGRDMFYNVAGRSPLCYSGGNDSSPSNCGRLVKSLNNPSYANVTVVQNTKKGNGDVLTLSLNRPTQAGFGWGVAYAWTRATEVSPLTSSIANSNWLNRAVFNPNEEVAANSATVVRNRITGNVNWSKAFVGSYKTSFGLFYEGRTGRAYSWTYGNDANGDGVSGNDLLYVPKAPGSGEVLFRLPTTSAITSQTALDVYQQQTAAAAEAKFWAVVDANPGLRKYKGRVVGRNSSFSTFVNSFDVKLSQEIPGLFGKQKGTLSLDILNVGNLIKRDWGHIDEIGFGSGGQVRNFVNYAGIDPKTGKVIYSVTDPVDYTIKQSRNESQWAAQVTVKYEF